jgi:hypothetical protein
MNKTLTLLFLFTISCSENKNNRTNKVDNDEHLSNNNKVAFKKDKCNEMISETENSVSEEEPTFTSEDLLTLINNNPELRPGASYWHDLPSKSNNNTKNKDKK